MTFPVSPRGSQSRSSGQVVPADDASERSQPPATSISTGVVGSLGIEAAFMAAGDAGLPVRLGLLAQFRPHPIFGLGLHLDTNFTDEVLVGLRAEGEYSIIPEFSLYAALEGGVRVLTGQEQFIADLETRAPVTGILAVLGGEMGARIPVDDVSIDLWGRFLYSPSGSVSIPGMEVEGSVIPAQGAMVDGIEFSVGIRLNLEFPFGARPRSSEAEDDVSQTPTAPPTPLTQARSALQDFNTSLDTVIERAQTLAPAQATEDHSHTGPSREEILSQIQADLQSLDDTAEALDEEISSSLREYGEWIEGTEILSHLQSRMDRIYFGQLAGDSPTVDLDTIRRFVTDFSEAIQNQPALRYRLRQREESYGAATYLDRQLRALVGKMAEIQRRVHHDRSLGVTPADLDDPIAVIVEARGHLRELREGEEPADFRPGSERMTAWRSTLDTMAARIEQLNGDVPEALKQELRDRHQELRGTFEQAVANVELEAAHLQLYREQLRDHIVAFQSARNQAGEGNFRARRTRAQEALTHMQTMVRVLRASPESFRIRFRRTMDNLSELLNNFVRSDLPARDSHWHQAGQGALEILRLLNPEYDAPTLPVPRRVRRTPRPTDSSRVRPRPTPPPPSPSGPPQGGE